MDDEERCALLLLAAEVEALKCDPNAVESPGVMDAFARLSSSYVPDLLARVAALEAAVRTLREAMREIVRRRDEECVGIEEVRAANACRRALSATAGLVGDAGEGEAK